MSEDNFVWVSEMGCGWGNKYPKKGVEFYKPKFVDIPGYQVEKVRGDWDDAGTYVETRTFLEAKGDLFYESGPITLSHKCPCVDSDPEDASEGKKVGNSRGQSGSKYLVHYDFCTDDENQNLETGFFTPIEGGKVAKFVVEGSCEGLDTGTLKIEKKNAFSAVRIGNAGTGNAPTI